MSDTAAYWCSSCWERHELPPKRTVKCPDCGDKLRRCSRYEWFLIDALEQAATATGRGFRLIPQYPIHDHRGFAWYWDVFIWINGTNDYGGAGLLIDVDGSDHARQPKYRGPGGGYTRDYDKQWETNKQRLYHKNIHSEKVTNDDCRMKGRAVYATAGAIVARLVKGAGPA
jgi:hypothetical protein